MGQPTYLIFIIEELTGYASEVAQNRSGVRILCQVLERFPQEISGELITEATEDLGELCRHRYGNYLVNLILDRGTVQQRKRVLKTLADNPFAYSRHSHANVLIRKALSCTDLERDELLKKLLENPMACRDCYDPPRVSSRKSSL